MTTYTAHFRSDAEFASHDFEAETADEALALAIKFNADDSSDLWFEHYAEMPVNEIAVCDRDEYELAVWYSDDLRLRLAAPDLLDSLSDLVAQIQGLRGESSCIDEDLLQGDEIKACFAAIAKAKGGAA
jgi:hypothetical protein